MNKYELTYVNGDSTDIEADGYELDEGFLTFKVGGVNMASIQSKHIDVVRFKGPEKIAREDLDSFIHDLRKNQQE